MKRFEVGGNKVSFLHLIVGLGIYENANNDV
jgi:hypothetical protein